MIPSLPNYNQYPQQANLKYLDQSKSKIVLSLAQLNSSLFLIIFTKSFSFYEPAKKGTINYGFSIFQVIFNLSVILNLFWRMFWCIPRMYVKFSCGMWAGLFLLLDQIRIKLSKSQLKWKLKLGLRLKLSMSFSNDNCHTRSNLGISALLEILQTCKLDHNVAVKCTWDHPPPTHPPLS